jgi:hypothetical protein
MPWVGGNDRNAGTWVDEYQDPGSYEPNAMQGYWSAVEAAQGLPYGFMRSMAGIESQGGQNLTSGTGAVGPFQFTGSAANQVGVPKGATTDPFVGAAAAGSLANYNREQFVRQLGREPSGFELYMMHQLGAGGAMAAIGADPNTPISSVPYGSNMLTQGVSGIGGNTPVGSFVDVFRQKYAGYDPSTQYAYTSGNLDPQMQGNDNADLQQFLRGNIPNSYNSYGPVSTSDPRTFDPQTGMPYGGYGGGGGGGASYQEAKGGSNTGYGYNYSPNFGNVSTYSDGTAFGAGGYGGYGNNEYGYGGGGNDNSYLNQFNQTPAAYNTLNFTVGGPSSPDGGGGYYNGETWVPYGAPSAASLNGFSSGNGSGVYGGGSGGNEYGYGGQSYSGATGSDWAMNYGGGMSASDAAAQFADYQALQNNLQNYANIYEGALNALPSSAQNYQSQIVGPTFAADYYTRNNAPSYSGWL